MQDERIIAALARLDGLLLRVCDLEERRAQLLAGGPDGSGWAGVRNLVRPTAQELLYDADLEEPLFGELPEAFKGLWLAFGLAPVELEALVVLLAPHIEPRYRVLYGVLQDDVNERWVTERALLTILGRTPDRRRALQQTLSGAGRLRQTGLVTATSGQPPLGMTVDLAPEIRNGLLGLAPPGELDVVPLQWVPGEASGEEPTLAVVHGPGNRRQRATEILGGRAHLVSGSIRTSERAGKVARTLWGLGALHQSVPVVDLSGLDSLAARRLAEQLFHRASAYGGSLVLLTSSPLPMAVPHHEARRATFVARRQAWLEAAAERGHALDTEIAARFASAYRLEAAEIDAVFDSAGTFEEQTLGQHAIRLASERIPHGTAVLPERTFDDIVLMETTREALERLIYFVRNRDRVSESRGLEHRFRLQRGPIVLFSGRSGTGKTLGAEIVAQALRRPLHVVDLARLVSKYIGETEKNIDEVLAAGERAGAVLFFDEADSLFSQRTEVSNSNDRFANLEVGYLLQRIETHDGLVILATNLRQSIDEAFLRRFHTRVEFPLPGPVERRKIWEIMLPPGVPRSEDLVFETLGHAHRLSGGDIRNAALKAIFLAEAESSAVTQDHLERAVALELLELGRLSRRDLDAEPDHGSHLRAYTKALQESVEGHLRQVFLKEIHIVHGAPTKENLAGKRPAVSLALFRLAQPRRGGLRLGFVVSAWSSRAEEEHELLGVLHDYLGESPLQDADGIRVVQKVAESHDFDLLHRFWSSHGHPVRASVVVDVELG